MRPERRRQIAAFLACALATLAQAPAQAPTPPPLQCAAGESTTVLGERQDPAITLSTSVPHTHLPKSGSWGPAAYVRVLLTLRRDVPGDWNVTAYDRDYHVMARLEKSDFDKTAPQRWSGLLPSDVELDLSAERSMPELEISAVLLYPHESLNTRFYSVFGDTPNWTPLYSSGDAVAEKAGAAVGMLVSGALSGSAYTAWTCSGVMVAANLFLTNWHCGGPPSFKSADDFWASDVCANTIVDLGWDERARGENQATRQQYACTHVWAKDAKLDVALLGLEPVVGASGLIGKPAHVDLSRAETPTDGGEVFIVHHARGAPKMLTPKCRTGPQDGDEIVHSCDTDPGASGSPIFAEDGQIVALHHRGFLRNPIDCSIEVKQNAAISIVPIIAFLRAALPFNDSVLGLADPLSGQN